MKRVCRGALSSGSIFSNAAERVNGSSKETVDDSRVLLLGGVSA